jgi:hypothetical protein
MSINFFDMKRSIINIAFVFIAAFSSHSYCQNVNNIEQLKVVFIRHAEKPLKGDNLTCQGLNRSLQLPAIISSKFGVPDFIYVPSLAVGQSTKHSRMFQTIVPLAVKYNLPINTSYQEKDSAGIANDIKSKSGTVLVVWEHHAIVPIIKALGISNEDFIWSDDDYNSILIVTFPKGIATLTKDTEGVTPSMDCPF